MTQPHDFLGTASRLQVSRMELSDTVQKKLAEAGIVTGLQLFELISMPDAQLQKICGLSAQNLRATLSSELGFEIPSVSDLALEDALSFPTGLAAPSSIHSGTSLQVSMPQGLSVIDVDAEIKRRAADLPSGVLLCDAMQPVGDQGRRGSCVGWAVTASMEYLFQRPLSPGYIWRGAKSRDRQSHTDGTNIYIAAEHAYQIGQVQPETYSYEDACNHLPIEHLVDLAREHRTGGHISLLGHLDEVFAVDLIKLSLAGRLHPYGLPMVPAVGVATYPSMTTQATSHDGIVRMPLTGENRCGGHAMAVVGYLDAADDRNPFPLDYFVVRNSWGTAWAANNPLGLPGHALIPTMYFTSRSRLWEAMVYVER
jgi:hypothetical protein